MTRFFFTTSSAEFLQAAKGNGRYFLIVGGRRCGRNTLARKLKQWAQEQNSKGVNHYAKK